MTKTVVGEPLVELTALIGEWRVDVVHVRNPAEVLHGRASFEWWPAGERTFVLERWSMEHPDFPDSINILGATRSGGELAVHYFDTRGVHRVYDMALKDAVWTLSRKATDKKDFDQRFSGTFSADRRTITGEWQRTDPGKSKFMHDLDVTYTKVS